MFDRSTIERMAGWLTRLLEGSWRTRGSPSARRASSMPANSGWCWRSGTRPAESCRVARCRCCSSSR
ncbi:protein of unknown function [Streptomyces murinus]